jgi:hypothetical protein
VVVLLTGLLIGCGSDDGGGSSINTSAPVIGNARTTLGGSCVIEGVNESGTVETVLIDYTDPDGNVAGGTLEVTTVFSAGGSVPLAVDIPSSLVFITGTTSGTLTLELCLRFGDSSSVSESIVIRDEAGAASNVLVLEVLNPGGVPLVPRGTDPLPAVSPRK